MKPMIKNYSSPSLLKTRQPITIEKFFGLPKTNVLEINKIIQSLTITKLQGLMIFLSKV